MTRTLGLLHEGAAAVVLEDVGMRASTVRSAVRELFPSEGRDQPDAPPPQESAAARDVIQRAAALAEQAGRSEVDAGDLPAELVRDPDSRAGCVLSHLGVSTTALKQGLESYVGPGKQRRRKLHRADLACSFCAKSKQQVTMLIAGPGVYICDECIDLCHEIVTEAPDGPR